MSKNKIRFDLTKHDDKITDAQAREFDRIKKDTMAKVAALWENKCRTLKAKRPPKGSPPGTSGVTAADLNRMLYDIENVIHANCKHPALKEWVEFTIDALEAKIGQVVATGGVKNLFTPYRPTFVEPAKGDKELPSIMTSTPKGCVFETEEEFRGIPEVELVASRKGFVCFLLDYSKVVAMFVDGEMVPVGSVCNGVGLERVPGVQDFQKELLKGQRN